MLLWVTMYLFGCGGTASTPGGETTPAGTGSQGGEAPSQEGVTVADLKAICNEVPCRPDTEVQMMVDEERFFQTQVYASPYVYDDIVNILTGEAIFFEADVAPDGRLTNLMYVSNAVHPEKTFEVSFSQNTEGRNHRGMLLHIKSPFDGIVRYRAGISIVGREGILKTSTCPLHKGIPAMEMWQDLILHVVLSDFRIVDPKDPDASICN